MRPPSRKLMRTDFIIQVMMISPMLTATILGVFRSDGLLIAALVMFLLGIWQVCSSLYTNFILQLKSRRTHLFLCIIIFLVFLLVTYFGNPEKIFEKRFYPLGYSFFIILQMIALYYARITYLDYHALDDDEKKSLIEDLDDDILDAGMVGEE